MTESRSIKKFFEDVSASRSFDKLEEFSMAHSWSSLPQDERKLLASLFIMQADEAVKNAKVQGVIEGEGLETAKKSLQRAVEIAPDCSEVWYQRGLMYAAYEQEEELFEAVASFEAATQLDSSFFDAWCAWASALTRLGIIYDELEFLYEAHRRYVQAAKYEEVISKKNNVQGQTALQELYWHWGLLHYLIGKISGEPYDFQQSIFCFRRAKELKLKSAHFYSDFALVLIEFATLVCRQELVLEAIQLYLDSLPEEIKNIPDISEYVASISLENKKELAFRLFNLASCYNHLFNLHLEQSHFIAASEYFEKAAVVDPSLFDVHLQWGNLLFVASQVWQDALLLRTCVEKYTQATKLIATHPVLLARFGQALAFLGSHDENVNLMAKAQTLVQEGLQFAPETVELWGSLAFILCQQGRYFVEDKYFLWAIDKAKQGLSLDEKCGMLWHCLAVAKFSLGELRDDLQLLQEASDAFQKASELEPGRFAYFWNEWGILFLSLADSTGEKHYLEAAEEKFERAILSHESVEPEWLFNYGCTLDFLGDISDDETYYERAIQALNTVLSCDPTYRGVRLHLACTYAHLGELMEDVEMFEKSLAHFEVATQEDPEDDMAWTEWGVSLMHLFELTYDQSLKHDTSHLQHAEHNFMQAVTLGNMQACYNLACLYSMQGNISDAMHYFEKAVVCDALPSYEAIVEDAWLENLRNTQLFQSYIRKLTKEGDFLS